MDTSTYAVKAGIYVSHRSAAGSTTVFFGGIGDLHSQ